MTNSAGETIGLAETTQPAQNQLKICVHIRPTDRFHSDALPTAPTGRWHLKFEADKKVLGDDNFAQVWIPRDDSLCGYPRRGRQSYFEHPDYIRFDKHGRGFREDNHPEQAGRPYYPIKRKTLVNVIVTGDQTFTASGYVVRDCDLARYSAGARSDRLLMTGALTSCCLRRIRLLCPAFWPRATGRDQSSG